MCFVKKTDKLISSIMRINSPNKNVGNLVPKIVYYPAEDDPCGIFYDPDRNQLVHADFQDGKLFEQYDVVPTHIEWPDENGNYAHTDDELLSLHDCDYCGEADDLSCYAYFSCIDEEE